MALIIHKYGGTSVATLDHIRRVAMSVKHTAEKGNQVVVVVSAMSGQTDRLLSMAAEITATPNEREQDALVATGEQSCAALLAITLNSMGQKAKSFMGMQLPMVTDNLHTRAHIVDLPTTILKQTIEEQQLLFEQDIEAQLNIKITLEFPATIEEQLLKDQKKDGPLQGKKDSELNPAKHD